MMVDKEFWSSNGSTWNACSCRILVRFYVDQGGLREFKSPVEKNLKSIYDGIDVLSAVDIRSLFENKQYTIDKAPFSFVNRERDRFRAA